MLAAGVFARLLARVDDRGLRRVYARRMARFVGRRPEPAAWMVYAIKCAIHWHHYSMARRMARDGAAVNTF